MWPDENWRNWRLVAKLDPDKPVTGEILTVIKHPGFNAVVVGGTQGITFDNSFRLVEAIKSSGYTGPLVQEISSASAVVAGVDAHFIPFVINAGDKKWFSDYYLEAIKVFGRLIDWGRVLTEGYIICNRNSAAGRLTGVGEVGLDDALAYAAMAEGIYNFPLLYIEYSGRFGDPDLVKAVAGSRDKIHLVYGGGISDVAKAQAMAGFVDTLIIGNVLYDDWRSALEIAGFVHDRGPGKKQGTG
ncbi:geranylgeranylglyceryl phosphate synthase-like protein YerE [Desulfocucumis palustris]|uniref:Geranylgeranylglyceryl phosphate synthase-like protein YerE n=1 Tax=Desulfocucumis palustris TaxID=1898651 RepID=A0A2L2XA24_9FIRM|nr:heptaprenylglyceryl phosphate synthase [Desulfocucumis palustris]GBF32902.1 geranylgeranylglyceryl phosphate synthase-like protein YerE [Desulfocucumis palustris]